MIKLVAIDLDGTLLNGKKEITPRNKAALIAAKAKGVKPEPKAKRILVLLLAAAAAALPIIAGRAAAGCTGPAAGTHPHDLTVSGLYIFELVLAGGVVRV